MKAAYSKPALEVITFALNETIAACDVKIQDNHSGDSCEDTELGARMKAMGMTFTADKEGCSGYGDFEIYCYYTSQNANGVAIFNS